MKKQPVQKREKKEYHGVAALIRDPHVVIAGILVLASLIAIFAPVGDRDGLTNLQFGLDLEGGSWIQLEFQADVVTVQTPVDIYAVAS
ncbi:MAG: preprotein translocase subunit SecD, partial [Methanocorpusculum sp.]|nr:preprotein translocase subunit SecD [Methanocorpusculum sp.]